jgi:hypothetical protein
MSAFLETLPDDYRFTEEDVDRAWDILMDTVFGDEGREITPQEEDFCAVMHAVEEVKAKLKFFPTKQGLLADVERESRERAALKEKQCQRN